MPLFYSVTIAGLALTVAAAAGLETRGTVTDPELREMSGLAPSLSRPGIWWALNDSGNAPRLYALNESGAVLSSVYVANAINFDWEDLAAYELGGLSYLAIADCGDNFSIRQSASIYLVPEPTSDITETLAERRIDFQFEDGPRDCEGIAVDARHGQILLTDKRRQPPGLYRLDLNAHQTMQLARRIADLNNNWPGRSKISAAQAPSWRGQVTALDLDRSGLRLLVLTNTDLLIYVRQEDEDWASATARKPYSIRLPLKLLPLAEAAAFALDGASVLITGEVAPAPLLRWVPPVP
jgi:hypothetical protein